MAVKFIFVTLCLCTIFVLLLTILKTDFVGMKIQVDLKHLYNPAYGNSTLLTKFSIETKCDFSFIVWIVTSSANDPSYRAALRYAYPNELLKSLNITRVFLLALPKEKNLQKHIIEESQEYNDLLQGDFIEDYRNLTLKHLMGLTWAIKNCKSTYLIKSDNDIVLDILEISRLLQQKITKKYTISGYVLKKMKPIRVQNNKWFVSKENYPNDVYPDFLSGWFYTTTLEVARILLSASRKFTNFFWIDDVFITGILRQQSGIGYEDLKSMYATDYRYLECCIRDRKKKLKCEFIAGPDGGKKELHMNFAEFSAFCQWNCIERTEQQSVLKTCVYAYEEKITAVNSTAEVHYI